MTELEKKVIDNGGWLELKGFGVARKVVAFDKVLEPEHSLKIKNHSPDGFNWGYSGSGPSQLALAILLELMEDTQQVLSMYQDFKSVIVSLLPSGSFHVLVDYGRWLSITNDYRNGTASGKHIHAYELIKFKVREHFFSKFLDVVHMGSEAVFVAGTREYEEIKNMSSEALSEYAEYLSAKTAVKVHQEDSDELKTVTSTITVSDDRVHITNLLGSGTHLGNYLELWDSPQD